MPNKQQVSCFTDLKGSTEHGEQGNEEFVDEIIDHARVVDCLVERLGGTHHKEMSDGHFVSFDFIEKAMSFAAQLQQYYKPQPALLRRNLSIKVGLSPGLVTPVKGDALGSGANKAARIQGKASPGQILVDADFIKEAETAIGSKVGPYFQSVGKRKLKGLRPEEQDLFSFDWEQYASDKPADGLAGEIYAHFENSKVEISRLGAAHLAKPGIIIWPVVPRDLPTAIHRGQAEIVRLLALLGWQINILIADCGAANVEQAYSRQFLAGLQEHLARRGVKVADAFFLSQFFEPRHPDYERMQSLFRDIASSLTLQDLLEINSKGYTPEIVSTEIVQRATLDCLRPALTLAAVSHLVEERTELSIVIAGADEHVLWNRAYDIATIKNRIGVLMNPKLTRNEFTERQNRAWPIWNSKDDLLRSMEYPNLPWWIFCLHAHLRAFPAVSVTLGDVKIEASDWEDEITKPEKLDKRALVEHVWPILNPSA